MGICIPVACGCTLSTNLVHINDPILNFPISESFTANFISSTLRCPALYSISRVEELESIPRLKKILGVHKHGGEGDILPRGELCVLKQLPVGRMGKWKR